MLGIIFLDLGIKMELKVNGIEQKVENLSLKNNEISFSLNGKNYHYEVSTQDEAKAILKTSNRHKPIWYVKDQKDSTVIIDGKRAQVESMNVKRNSSVGASDFTSPMPGKVFKVIKKEKEKVVAGETILILEAMKMEHAIKASKDGVIEKIFFKEGEQVKGGVELVRMKED